MSNTIPFPFLYAAGGNFLKKLVNAKQSGDRRKVFAATKTPSSFVKFPGCVFKRSRRPSTFELEEEDELIVFTNKLTNVVVEDPSKALAASIPSVVNSELASISSIVVGDSTFCGEQLEAASLTSESIEAAVQALELEEDTQDACSVEAKQIAVVSNEDNDVCELLVFTPSDCSEVLVAEDKSDVASAATDDDKLELNAAAASPSPSPSPPASAPAPIIFIINICPPIQLVLDIKTSVEDKETIAESVGALVPGPAVNAFAAADPDAAPSVMRCFCRFVILSFLHGLGVVFRVIMLRVMRCFCRFLIPSFLHGLGVVFRVIMLRVMRCFCRFLIPSFLNGLGVVFHLFKLRVMRCFRRFLIRESEGSQSETDEDTDEEEDEEELEELLIVESSAPPRITTSKNEAITTSKNEAITTSKNEELSAAEYWVHQLIFLLSLLPLFAWRRARKAVQRAGEIRSNIHSRVEKAKALIFVARQKAFYYLCTALVVYTAGMCAAVAASGALGLVWLDQLPSLHPVIDLSLKIAAVCVVVGGSLGAVGSGYLLLLMRRKLQKRKANHLTVLLNSICVGCKFVATSVRRAGVAGKPQIYLLSAIFFPLFLLLSSFFWSSPWTLCPPAPKAY
jgi:hypothetical protein